MKTRRRLLVLAAMSFSMLLGVQALLHEDAALAQPDTEEVSVTNPLIDCSTNRAYENKFIASAFRAGGGHTGVRNQQCNACHDSANPRPGMGDAPIASLGNALIHNRLSEPMVYEFKYGAAGEWESFELAPGAVRRHSYLYDRPGQNRSPIVRVRYETPEGRDVQHKLQLIATPNERLGAVYYFEEDRDRGVYMGAPTRTVARRGR